MCWIPKEARLLGNGSRFSAPSISFVKQCRPVCFSPAAQRRLTTIGNRRGSSTLATNLRGAGESVAASQRKAWPAGEAIESPEVGRGRSSIATSRGRCGECVNPKTRLRRQQSRLMPFEIHGQALAAERCTFVLRRAGGWKLIWHRASRRTLGTGNSGATPLGRATSKRCEICPYRRHCASIDRLR